MAEASAGSIKVKYYKGSPVFGFKGVIRQSEGHYAFKKVIGTYSCIRLLLWLNVDATLNIRSYYTLDGSTLIEVHGWTQASLSWKYTAVLG